MIFVLVFLTVSAMLLIGNLALGVLEKSSAATQSMQLQAEAEIQEGTATYPLSIYDNQRHNNSDIHHLRTCQIWPLRWLWQEEHPQNMYTRH